MWIVIDFVNVEAQVQPQSCPRVIYGVKSDTGRVFSLYFGFPPVTILPMLSTGTGTVGSIEATVSPHSYSDFLFMSSLVVQIIII
jgi:hypothetical protein